MNLCPFCQGNSDIQGVSHWNGQSKLALTDRDMHANKCLKVVLKSWDYAFFGTAASFYENVYFAPSIGPDDSNPEFQN